MWRPQPIAFLGEKVQAGKDRVRTWRAARERKHSERLGGKCWFPLFGYFDEDLLLETLSDMTGRLRKEYTIAKSIGAGSYAGGSETTPWTVRRIDFLNELIQRQRLHQIKPEDLRLKESETPGPGARRAVMSFMSNVITLPLLTNNSGFCLASMKPFDRILWLRLACLDPTVSQRLDAATNNHQTVWTNCLVIGVMAPGDSQLVKAICVIMLDECNPVNSRRSSKYFDGLIDSGRKARNAPEGPASNP